MSSDIAALAERLEQAGPESQAELLKEAFVAVFGREPDEVHSDEWWAWVNGTERFNTMLDCGAYLSAAEMLIPEDMRDEIEITTLYCVARVTINMNHGPDGGPFYGSNACNSIPLALAAACLRASIAGKGG